MPRKGVLEDLARVLRGDTPERPLVMPIAFDEITARDLGVSYRACSTDADAAEAAWNRAIEAYGLDAALIFIDDFFEYETFGVELTDEKNIPKAAKKYVAPSRDWLSMARLPDFTEARFPMRMELVRRLKRRWGDSLLVCASVAAPFTGAALLYGVEEALCLIYDDERLLRDTMELTRALSVACAKKLIGSGADMIWYGDCVASGAFLSVEQFDRFVFESTRRAITDIQAMGGVVIYHSGERRAPHAVRSCALGADIVNCQPDDMAAVYDAAGEQCCLMGNIDPIRAVMNGTPEGIRRRVSSLRAEMAGRPKFIVNTGEGIPVVTARENVRALLDAMRAPG